VAIGQVALLRCVITTSFDEARFWAWPPISKRDVLTTSISSWGAATARLDFRPWIP